MIISKLKHLGKWGGIVAGVLYIVHAGTGLILGEIDWNKASDLVTKALSHFLGF